MEQEKYEESLKLSILEKQNEISQKIKEKKQIRPKIHKISQSIFKISKVGNKKSKDMAT